MLIIRPTVGAICKVKGKAPIYAALYFLPLLIFCHALACGLICELFLILEIYKLHLNCLSSFRLCFSVSEYSHLYDS